eukprot:746736-Pyramimonas_sp.AAC.1
MARGPARALPSPGRAQLAGGQRPGPGLPCRPSLGAAAATRPLHVPRWHGGALPVVRRRGPGGRQPPRG